LTLGANQAAFEMKKFSSLAPLPLRRRFLEARMDRSVPTANVTLRVDPASCPVPSPNLGGSVVVNFERIGDRLQIIVRRNLLEDRHTYRLLYGRIPTVLRVLGRVRSSVRTAILDIGDGIGVPSHALCFCSERDDVLLIPDVYFVGTEGFLWARKLARIGQVWAERSDAIVWRGSLTGQGVNAAESMTAENIDLKLRVRMCLKLRTIAGVDAKVVKVGRRTHTHEKTALAETLIVGGKVRESTWARRKLAIDVDGNTNTWSNFYVRMLLGCCVIKIASPHGYRQWYYNKLEPWVHYVPARSDLSDLIEIVDWCRSHDSECRDIARAGQEFAMRRTVQSEIVDSVDRVNAALG
jgi:Glycosyl transferase family 90